MCNIRRFYSLRELYEADFNKHGIYASGRVCANAWDVFRRAPSRGGRGRRAAVAFVVCFGGISFFFPFFYGCGGIFVFFFRFLGAHTACGKLEAALPHHLSINLGLGTG